MVDSGTSSASNRFGIDSRENRLFRSLDLHNEGQVAVAELLDAIKRIGLQEDDVRLTETMASLAGFGRRDKLQEDDFCELIRPNILLIEQALQGKLVVPDFQHFCAEIESIYQHTKPNRAGNVADYIPQLARVAADQYGVALCTIDGQRFSIGDADTEFCVQSACKPITYCLALEEHGAGAVHRYVGREPSGLNFNELALGQDGEPHNPMINAGAIMCSSLIRQELDLPSRFDYLLDCWTTLCGGRKAHFNNAVYQSERDTADRNYALGYYMREHKAFPENADMHQTLEFYFQSCSIEVDVKMLAILAATLANGGVCPISGDRVLKTETVQNCLSLMVSCGMYDFSGEFAFSVGLPAKSGVSGAMMVVVPNVMGLGLWSPRIDARGNPIRCIDFCHDLVRQFNFHNYDNLTGMSEKIDPRKSRIEEQAKVGELIWAASKGDQSATHRLIVRGFDQNAGDYDQRTPLHLAAAEGRETVVRYLVENGAKVNPIDRWGSTPFDDARRNGESAITDLLQRHGGKPGNAIQQVGQCRSPIADSEESLIVQSIYAASAGDLTAIQRLVARGVDIERGDYDSRTPLHLAAAEGHEAIVQYFIEQSVELNPKDRWGHTPLDDARWHKNDRVVELLENHSA